MLSSPPFLVTAASGSSPSCARPRPSPGSLPLAVPLWPHGSSAFFRLQWLFLPLWLLCLQEPDSRLSDVERALLVTCLPRCLSEPFVISRPQSPCSFHSLSCQLPSDVLVCSPWSLILMRPLAPYFHTFWLSHLDNSHPSWQVISCTSLLIYWRFQSPGLCQPCTLPQSYCCSTQLHVTYSLTVKCPCPLITPHSLRPCSGTIMFCEHLLVLRDKVGGAALFSHNSLCIALLLMSFNFTWSYYFSSNLHFLIASLFLTRLWAPRE